MTTLKYKIITSKNQYRKYCNSLEKLIFSRSNDRDTKDEIAMLTLLIEKWDEEHNTLEEQNPIKLLHSLMQEHGLKAKDMVTVLGVSKGYVSDILHFKKGLSKELIRKLSAYFKISQEAFNRPCKLILPKNAHMKKPV